MSSSIIEETINPEKYEGLTRDFAEFCVEERQRKNFSDQPFTEDIFLEAVQLILDKLAPEKAEENDDH